MRLFEWKSDFFPGSPSRITEFINYLSGVWQNRNRFVDLNDEVGDFDPKEDTLRKQQFFDFSIDGKISARNYVGVVQYNGIRIEVYPKIFANDDSQNTGLWQLQMLYWLSYCRKIKFPYSSADLSTIQFDDFLELLIYVFANLTEETVSKQPFQDYQILVEETSFLRGRISFDDYTRHNLISGNWQNFYCSHQPYVYDNLFNRIVKCVTKRLLLISNNSLNQEALSRILFILSDVTEVDCFASDCDKVSLNPLFSDHQSILNLCKLYLSNQVVDMENQESTNFCFLLPMEYVFEDFIYGFLSDKLPALNFRSQSMEYLAIRNDSSLFQIRNDIYLPGKLIIDTKYKIRSTTDGPKAGVSQVDLYQMISYAIRRNCNDVLLLYPHFENSRETSATFQVPSQMLSSNITIEVRNIDITFQVLSEADRVMIERVRGLHPLFA